MILGLLLLQLIEGVRTLKDGRTPMVVKEIKQQRTKLVDKEWNIWFLARMAIEKIETLTWMKYWTGIEMTPVSIHSKFKGVVPLNLKECRVDRCWL